MAEDCAAKLRWIRTSNHNLSLAVNAELRYGSRAVFQFEIEIGHLSHRGRIQDHQPHRKQRKAVDKGVSNGLCDGGKRLRVDASNLVKINVDCSVNCDVVQ
jgi:hypothetical protein